MSLDLRQGDVLVVDGVEYPIRACNAWLDPAGEAGAESMRMMCIQTASSKRRPPISAGKRGEPEPKLSGLKCTPLDALSYSSAQIFARPGTQAPTNLKETYVDGGDTFYYLIVEELLTNVQ